LTSILDSRTVPRSTSGSSASSLPSMTNARSITKYLSSFGVGGGGVQGRKVGEGEGGEGGVSF
jgi:hypothetical protein